MSEMVRVRVDSDVKARAAEVLHSMGLSMSDAIRLTLVRIADEKRIPFELRVPNAETLEACRELKDGRGQSYASADEMYKDLGI